MLHFTMNMPFYLMTFYGTIMIITVLILRALFKNKLPKFVFPIFWSVILLRLLIPFSFSSPLSLKVPDFSIMNFFDETASASIIEDVSYEAVPNTAQTVSTAVAETAAEMTAAEMTADISYLPELYGIQFSKLSILTVYFIGLILVAGTLFYQKRNYSKRLKNCLLIEHNETINALLRERNMGHILVFTNDEIASPLVCGLIAPKIYLPTRMDFTNTELLRHVLCHETMHIRRKDNWMKAVMLIALCVNWFNPLVWVMSKCLSADLETACDAAVLYLYNDDESKKQYAMSLLTMAITGNRPTLLYSAFSKTEVEKRIQNVLRYKKASAFLLTLSICFVLSGSIVFATGGQAPFSHNLTAFCASDNCRWGVSADLSRDIALGENPRERAEKIIFDILGTDTTSDPQVLENEIKSALSDEFRVEKSAFTLNISLCLDREELFKEYAAWGLVRPDDNTDFMLYNGETIRTYKDDMLGRYQSSNDGTVDITVVRNRLGFITAVMALHEGDADFDRRTEDMEQQQSYHHSTAVYSYAEETTVVEDIATH